MPEAQLANPRAPEASQEKLQALLILQNGEIPGSYEVLHKVGEDTALAHVYLAVRTREGYAIQLTGSSPFSDVSVSIIETVPVSERDEGLKRVVSRYTLFELNQLNKNGHAYVNWDKPRKPFRLEDRTGIIPADSIPRTD